MPENHSNSSNAKSSETSGNCPVCASPLESASGPWKIQSCGSCGHRYGRGAKEFQDTQKGVKYFDDGNYITYRKAAKTYFEDLAERRVGQFLDKGYLPAGARVLEIGCSTGEALVRLKQRGMEAIGHDEADKAVAYAREHYGVAATSDFTAAQKGTFDAVFAFHVIEHVADPVGFVSAITAKLKSGGYLYLRMPHIHSLTQSLFGNEWPGFSVEHLQFFGKSSVTQLFEKTGFSMVDVGTTSHARFFAGALRRKLNGGSRPSRSSDEGGNSMPKPGLLKMAMLMQFAYAPVALLESLTDKGDEFWVIARKA